MKPAGPHRRVFLRLAMQKTPVSIAFLMFFHAQNDRDLLLDMRIYHLLQGV